MSWIATTILGVLALASSVLPSSYDSWLSRFKAEHFGATNFPTSLDSLTNPAATDSVATVSHSGQHSNANDAIEALEAKLGITASTPVSGAVLVGDGTGTSRWSAFATTTSLSTTNATTTNLMVTGSTTLQQFTFTRATGTAATTTNIFSTVSSSTDLFSTTFRGGGLGAPCTGTNFVQYSSGSFSCGSSAVAGVTTFSTTTTQNMATTSLKTSDGSLPSGVSNYEIRFTTASTTGVNAASVDTVLRFNTDVGTNYSYNRLSNGSASAQVDVAQVRLYDDDANRALQYFKINITNNTGIAKMGTWEGFRVGTTTGAQSFGLHTTGLFSWANTAALTQVDIALEAGGQFLVGTQIQVMGW